MGEARRRQAEIAEIKRRNKIEDMFGMMATQWPMIPPEELPAILAARGRVIHAVHRHDDWCRTRNGGTGADCNCNAHVTYHLQPNNLD